MQRRIGERDIRIDRQDNRVDARRERIIRAVDASGSGPTSESEDVGVNATFEVGNIDTVEEVNLTSAASEFGVSEGEVGVTLFINRITAQSTDEIIVARTTIEDVITALAIEEVVAQTAAQS